MRNYEMMYILRPDLIDQEVKQIIDKYETFIKDRGAEDINITTLGKKRLAYTIKKHQTGIYIQMNYKAQGDQVAPLERAMRISEEVLRYLTLCLDEEDIIEVDMRNTNAVVEPILPSTNTNSDSPRKPEPTLKDNSDSSADKKEDSSADKDDEEKETKETPEESAPEEGNDSPSEEVTDVTEVTTEA